MGIANPNQSDYPLVPVTKESVKDEYEQTAKVEADPHVDEWLDRLLGIDPNNSDDRDKGRGEVECLGLELQELAARQSELLKKPVSDLYREADDNGKVGNALVDLQVQVERLDPSKFNFEPGWMGRMVGKLPGAGTPLRKYFSRYKSVQSVVDAILASLDRGRDELSRDIVTLAEDQKRMRELSKKLAEVIRGAETLDSKIQAKVMEAGLDSDKKHFLEEEILFPLRQRTMDLQQQLAISQQGVIASELIIRNNRELIRGVNRATHVTATALNVGVTVALALESQKRVIKKIDAASEATSSLIAGTAARLKTQGTEIHQRAARSQVNMDALRSAFSDLNDALSQLSEFRRQALPEMAKSVHELDQLTSQGEKAIRRMEAARRSHEGTVIELKINR